MGGRYGGSLQEGSVQITLITPQLLRTLLELFHLRDTFRTMRGGPVWK
jgi:hypothetical protein